MKCCGKKVESKFCPDCGKQQNNRSVLWDLVAHCRSTAQTFQTKADNPQRAYCGEVSAEVLQRFKVRHMENSARWSNYAALLEKALLRMEELP